MKYIKLFENFDRYEFGEHKDVYDIPFSEFLSDIKPYMINFTPDEVQKIELLFGEHPTAHFPEDETDHVFKFVKFMPGPNHYYDVYSLGDYCYILIGSMFTPSNGNPEVRLISYEVFDGFEDLCEKLEKLK